MKVGVATFFINEAKYLKEWVEFHKLVGIDNFYLFNNNSKDNWIEVLESCKDNCQICVWNDPFECKSYWDVVSRRFAHINWLFANTDCDWIVNIDSDEFLYPTVAGTVKDVLEEFGEDVGQVGVNWKLFGHNFYNLQPGELLIEKLTKKRGDALEDRHIKPIVRPHAIHNIDHPHFCNLKPGFKKVNTSGELQDGPFNEPPLFDKLIINHYTLRDMSYAYTEKMRRYQVLGQQTDKDWMDRANDIEDTFIQRFLPALKEVIG